MWPSSRPSTPLNLHCLPAEPLSSGGLGALVQPHRCMRSSISAARALFMLRKEPTRFDSPKEAESLCGISSFDSPKEAALRASALRASPEDFARSSFDSLPPPLSVDEALARMVAAQQASLG